MKVISKYYEEGTKCGSCNWRVNKLFCFEGQNPDEIGMCGECFAEFLVEEGYKVINTKDKKEIERFIKKLHMDSPGYRLIKHLQHLVEEKHKKIFISTYHPLAMMWTEPDIDIFLGKNVFYGHDDKFKYLIVADLIKTNQDIDPELYETDPDDFFTFENIKIYGIGLLRKPTKC